MRYAGQWFDCVTKVIHGFQWILWPRKKTRWHAYKRCNKKKTATKPAADYRRARRNLYFGGTKRKLTIVQQSWIIVRCPWSFGRHKINVSLWNTCTDWGIVIRWATSFGWRYRIVYIGKQRLQLVDIHDCFEICCFCNFLCNARKNDCVRFVLPV